MKALVGLFAAVAVLCALASAASATATRKVIGPNAAPQITASAQPVATRTPAVAQPSAQPTCGLKQSQVYADPNGCTYACADQRQVIVARALNAACVFPSTTATP